MHAAGYLNACCENLGIADAAKEYKTCRAIMLRRGAGSAVDRIRRKHPKELEASEKSWDALNYLDKRRDNTPPRLNDVRATASSSDRERRYACVSPPAGSVWRIRSSPNGW